MGAHKQNVEMVKPETDGLFDPRDFPKLTLEQKAAGDRAYGERIDELKRSEKGLTRNILVLYWERGEFVSAVFRFPEQYGNISIRKLASDLKAAPDQVRAWFRFFNTYSTREALDALAEKGITWKKALILTTVHDEAKRTEMEGRAVEISSEALQDEARKFSSVRKEKAKIEGKKVGRGGTKPRAVFKNLELAVAVFSRTLMKALEALETLKSADPASFERANETRAPADSAVTELWSKLDKYLEASKKI